jgi:uncharacterized membrane protein YfcA
MIAFVLILTGLCVGIISSFFGVGGGIIAIPALYTIFPRLSPQIVIGSIVSMVAINSAVNLYNYYRKKRIPDWRFCLWTTWPSMVGVNIGITITSMMPDQHVKGVFATLLIFVAIQTFFSKAHSGDKTPQWKPPEGTIHLIKGMLVGFSGGLVAGLTGLGGGLIIIPMFLIFLKMPLSWTPLYSNVMMGASGVVGSIRHMMMKTQGAMLSDPILGHWQVGQVNWAIVVILSLAAFFTSRLGVLMNERLSPKLARTVFAVFMLIASLNVFFSAYGYPWKK